MMPAEITFQGSDPKLLLKFKNRMTAKKDKDRFFRMRIFGGLWFVESLKWTTDRNLVPPLRFTVILRSVLTVRRPRKQKRTKGNA